MNLPNFSPIITNPRRSTYYTFSKALADFDRSVSEDSEYYFTKMVALNLPIWRADNTDRSIAFEFLDTSGTVTNRLHNCGFSTTPPDIDLIHTFDPNYVIPALFQYYTENIIRQPLLNGVDEIAEIAFWKTIDLILYSLTPAQKLPYIYGTNGEKSIITFVNDVNVSNFIQIQNNHGWCELIGSVPNMCKKLIIDTNSWRVPSSMSNITQITAEVYNDKYICDYLTDMGNTVGYNFNSRKSVIDFENLTFDSTTEDTFDFNMLLLFYKDSTGREKLHGVDFIYPFDDQLNNEIGLQTIIHNTNKIQTFGYSFKFLVKTNAINQESIDTVYSINEGTYFDTFEETLGAFNSFLTQQTAQNINSDSALNDFPLLQVINSQSTAQQVPSAKAVYDYICAFANANHLQLP